MLKSIIRKFLGKGGREVSLKNTFCLKRMKKELFIDKLFVFKYGTRN